MGGVAQWGVWPRLAITNDNFGLVKALGLVIVKAWLSPWQ